MSYSNADFYEDVTRAATRAGIITEGEAETLDAEAIACKIAAAFGPVRIGINCDGGVVQNVFADRRGVAVRIIDYDCEKGEGVQIDQGDGTTEEASLDCFEADAAPEAIDNLFSLAEAEVQS